MGVLDQWEAKAKKINDEAHLYADDDHPTAYEWTDRVIALIDLVHKKDCLVKTTLNLLEECGMPSNAKEHEWLTEALALTEQLK